MTKRHRLLGVGTLIFTVVLAVSILARRLNAVIAPVEQSIGSSQQEDLLTWEELAVSLRNAECDLSSLDAVESCDVFSRVLSFNRKDIFLDMASQRDRPFVALFGFFAIKKKFPTDASSVALGILLRSHRPAFPLHAALYAHLSDEKDSTVVQSILSSLTRIPWIPDASFSGIIAVLHCSGAYDWYHNPSRAACSTSFEAAVFDRINGECLNDGRKRSKLMQDRLRQYAEVPGFPRLIYVIHVARTDEGFARVIASVLEDQDLGELPDIAMVCHRHRDYIKKNIDISSLKITAERKKMIEEALSYERQP